VIFLQGCNMRCPYCHNPSLVIPQQFETPLEVDEVLAFLEKRKGQLDGVVISGGEPTVHRDLPDFVQRVRDLGYQVKLDTNGSNPDMLRELLRANLLDYVAMDVKGPLKNYTECSGARISPESIRSSIWIIKNSGVAHEFRTTVVPGLHTVPELKEIVNLVRGAKRYALQTFRSENTLRPEFRNRKPFDFASLAEEKSYFEKRVDIFELRGGPEKNAESPVEASQG
jgi:pyruvate formate lyase activating enzyme